MSKTYTVIARRNGMIYPIIVRGAGFAADAEKELWRLGEGYEIIATVDGEPRVHAPHFGIGYEINLGEAPDAPDTLASLLGPF